MLQSPRELVDLIARVARRDRQAFAALYQATSAKLFGIVVRILGRRELAEEVLQEVYVRIWERAGDFDAARASPITWMAAIARNRAIDEVRRARPAAIDDHPEVLDIADPAELQVDRIERSEETARMLDCLGRLDPKRRDIVRLAYIEGLSREALANRYRRPVATIKTWLHRSLKELKDCLGS